MTLITLKLMVPTSVRSNVFYILGGIKLLKILNVNTDLQKQSKKSFVFGSKLDIRFPFMMEIPPKLLVTRL